MNVTAHYGENLRNETEKHVGTAKFDEETERLIFLESDQAEELDLTQVIDLTMTPELTISI